MQHTAAVLSAEAGAAQPQGQPAGSGAFAELEPLPLPPPMIPGNFERVTPACLMEVSSVERCWRVGCIVLLAGATRPRAGPATTARLAPGFVGVVAPYRPTFSQLAEPV